MDSKDATPTLGDQISSALNNPEVIKDAAAKSAEAVADYIRKHPYQTLGAAFAAGALVGIFFGKRKSE